MSDGLLLTERASYRLGYQDYMEGRGDFARRRFFGDERRAYMLGRVHASRQLQRTRREWVVPPFKERA